MHIKNKN